MCWRTSLVLGRREGNLDQRIIDNFRFPPHLRKKRLPGVLLTRVPALAPRLSGEEVLQGKNLHGQGDHVPRRARTKKYFLSPSPRGREFGTEKETKNIFEKLLAFEPPFAVKEGAVVQVVYREEIRRGGHKREPLPPSLHPHRHTHCNHTRRGLTSIGQEGEG